MTESSFSQVFRPGLMEGSVAVVSGAGTGIGRAISVELAGLGATVVGAGRREEPLAGTADLCRDLPGQFRYSTLDIRDEAAVDDLAAGCIERESRVDVLVNNAGGQFLSPAEEVTPRGFRTVVELNLVGTWLMTHAFATRAFIPAGGGKVVSLTLSPHAGMPGMVHSGAARAGVENMMRTLSIEWARFGITTCAVAPGQIATEAFVEKYPAEVVENVEGTIPLGHLGEPEDIAWMVAYLASPAGRFVSGSVITVDGARDNHFGPWPPALRGGPGDAGAYREERSDPDTPHPPAAGG